MNYYDAITIFCSIFNTIIIIVIYFIFCIVRADITDIGPDSEWIVESPEDKVVAVRGKPYTLQCHSTLSNVTYRWIYNNRPLDLVNDTRREILPGGSLFFKTVRNPKIHYNLYLICSIKFIQFLTGRYTHEFYRR